MATRKQAQKTWEELALLKDNLQNDVFPEIKKTKEELDEFKRKMIDGEESVKSKIEDLENKIITLKDEAIEKVNEILSLHKKVFENTDENNSIEKQFEDFLLETEKLFIETENKKKDFDLFYEKVFGIKQDDGEYEGGLKKEIEKYEKKYQNLFVRIESLLPGATSVGLAKVFEDKVIDFRNEEKKWTKWFLVVAIILAIYYGVYTVITPESNTLTESFLKFFHRTPFLLFAVWILIFIGNRRAENKKLEESYKHKEVMARSYVGYKEHIEEIEEESNDKELLSKHMNNLLDAIKDNSGDFLSKKGDDHPMFEYFKNEKDIKKEEIETEKEDSK